MRTNCEIVKNRFYYCHFIFKPHFCLSLGYQCIGLSTRDQVKFYESVGYKLLPDQRVTFAAKVAVSAIVAVSLSTTSAEEENNNNNDNNVTTNDDVAVVVAPRAPPPPPMNNKQSSANGNETHYWMMKQF